jgi:4-hydroxy-3-methylbut-2-enyl diphosphate reductase
MPSNCAPDREEGGRVIVLRARELGMCFGVRDALGRLEQIPRPERVTVHGELVHNPEVQRDLDRRGFRQSDEAKRTVPSTPLVLVTAHGISERERARLQSAGKQLIDTTCPLVEKAHQAARELAAEDRRLVVLGKRGHVEVRGIVEDHPEAVVVERPEQVTGFGAPRLGVICQTTLASATAARLVEAIRSANPGADLRFVDTVCAPTKARQEALAELLDRVEALVVVGGRNSNNTGRLVAHAEAAEVPTVHVEWPDDVALHRLSGHRVVGLTAGTSTLARTVDAVEARLRSLDDRAFGPAQH